MSSSRRQVRLISYKLQQKKGADSTLVNLSNTNKPILLLGDVGVGKTTFIEHLFLSLLKDQGDSLVALRIDFGSTLPSAEEIPRRVVDAIIQQLNNSYGIDIYEDNIVRGILHEEIRRFQCGIHKNLKEVDPPAYAMKEIKFLEMTTKNSDSYLPKVFAHLIRGRKKRPVLIYDNMDQRSEKLQIESFVSAQLCASSYRIPVLIALRPETFSRAKISRELSGYHPKAFTISPPRLDEVIMRRISISKKIFSGELEMPGKQVVVTYKSVVDILDVLLYTFESENDKSIITFCQDMSNGSVRLALDYLTAFLSSPNVDSAKILTIHDEQKSGKRGPAEGYAIPLHEFIRGILYADRKYYMSEKSNVPNIFKYDSGSPINVFLMWCILCHVLSESRSTSKMYDRDSLMQAMSSAGFDQKEIQPSITKCLMYKFLDNEFKSESEDKYNFLRITPAGNYIAKHLVAMTAYLEAVSLDTPLSSPGSVDAMNRSQSLVDRLRNVEALVRYFYFLIKRYECDAIAKIINYTEWRVAITQEVGNVYSRIGGKCTL